MGWIVTGPGPFEIEDYRPDLEPWYVFVHNDGIAGLDSHTPFRAPVEAYPGGRGRRSFVARDGDIYAGLVDVVVSEEDPRVAEIDIVAVLPSHRRRGLGGLLVGAAVRWAAQAGVERLYAVVPVSDPRIHGFWQMHGFELECVSLEIERGAERRRVIASEISPALLRGRKIVRILYTYRRNVGKAAS